MRCQVCGDERVVGVFPSTCGDYLKFPYCKRCLDKCLEPYNVMINYISLSCLEYDGLNGVYKEIVDNNLEFYGKTIEQFNEDLRKANNV